MSRTEGWVTVIPGEGDLQATAQLLLSLADPREVLTQSNGTEFLVPPEVADAYHAQLSPQAAVQPKRRGRAPKITEQEA